MGKIRLSLAAARVNAGYNQEEAANLMHVNKRTIIAWENGESEPRVTQAYQLSEIYKLPIDCIFMPLNLADSEKGE